MRILKTCMVCAAKKGLSSPELGYVFLNNEGYFEYTCSEGHATATLLQMQRFEFLFESGASALIEGYPREAITSFASSLERFMEFAIRVILRGLNLSDDIFPRFWTLVKSQSERQFGAFVYLCSVFDATLLEKIKGMESLKKTRNDVVHKGYIPNHDEAVKYGDKVLDFIFTLLERFKAKCPDALKVMNELNLAEIRSKISNPEMGSLAMMTIINFSAHAAMGERKTLEEGLKGLREKMEWGVSAMKQQNE